MALLAGKAACFHLAAQAGVRYSLTNPHAYVDANIVALSGIATAEMCMVDLGLEVRLGSGVAAAQEIYRQTVAEPAAAA